MRSNYVIWYYPVHFTKENLYPKKIYNTYRGVSTEVRTNIFDRLLRLLLFLFLDSNVTLNARVEKESLVKFFSSFRYVVYVMTVIL